MKSFSQSLRTLFMPRGAFGHNHALREPPHVFYRKGKVLLHAIVDGRAVLQTVDDPKEVSIKVQVGRHNDHTFTVQLKPQLINEPAIAVGANKILFVADIEGEFAIFSTLLMANQVIDQQYNWTFGNGKLVVCGDLFDRGKYVTETLWLLYKLEQEAVKQGGYVHVILGNHDIMNLSGDLRYIHGKYLKVAKHMGIAYQEFYAPDTELGRWLRTKNVIEKIGDTLCAHAGIAPAINQRAQPLQQINAQCRPYYDLAKQVKLVAERDPTVAIYFDSKTSPFWYRGYFDGPRASQQEVDATLALYGCTCIAVGHTIAPENIGFYYDDKVLGLDVNEHTGKYGGALYEMGIWYKVDHKGQKNQLSNNKPG